MSRPVFKKKLLASCVAAACASASLVMAAQAQAQDGEMEEVVVRGIKSSLERSIDIKRDDTRIVEAITADDIGKMPDQNVAESLQRLPGIQIDRRDGVGTQVRIRGLSQNITLLNGESFFSGMENFQLGESQLQLGNSLESIPSELLGGVEVYKTPVASMVEGGMGGVVNLKTREALSLDDLLLAANVKFNQGLDSKDTEPSAFVVVGNNWGNFGAIFSVTMDNRVVQNDVMQNFSRENTQVRCTQGGTFDFDTGCTTGQSYLVPGMTYITDSQQDRERTGTALNLQWEPTDAWELGFDWFHSELDLKLRQYSIKHPMSTDAASGIDETQPFVIAGGNGPGQVGVLQSGTFTLTGGTGGGNPGGEVNSGGDVTNVESDNFVLSGGFDNGGSVRYSFNIAGATTDLKQRSGWSDQRFSPYAFNGWTSDVSPRTLDYGFDTDGDGNNDINISRAGLGNGYDWVIPNQVAGDSGVRSYTYRAGGLPDFNWTNTAILSDPDYWTYKSHWALGSNFEQDFFAARGDVEWDINAGDLKTLKFGIRQADQEADFDQLRYLHDFSQTEGAASPTRFNADGSVAAATTLSPLAPPGASMNVGVQEAVYYDLCGNGGIPAGDFPGNTNASSTGFCDIDSDGITDNVGAGPYGYFVDAAIGLKAFDLRTSGGMPLAAILYGQPTVTINESDPDVNFDLFNDRGEIVRDPNTGAIIGDGDLGDSQVNTVQGRFGSGSPNYLPWQTFNDNPGRYVELTDFFPSGGYHSNILFENADTIAGNPENWIDNVVTPDTPGDWFLVPVNSWEVEQNTTAFYVEGDLEGDLGGKPYTLNAGVRYVQTDVDVTHAVVENPQALAEQWSQSTDIWNSQGALLEGTYRFVTDSRDYSDTLPSLNFTMDLSDDTKLRASAAKVIARPDLRSLGQGLLLNFTRAVDATIGDYFQYTGGAGGNTDLDPFRANQFDVAYERYFGELGLFSVGVFYKDVDSFIQGETRPEFHEDAAGGREAGVNRPQNGSGGSVQGFEFQFQQSWENGFGVAFNYTYSDSDTDTSTTLNQNVGLPGVSENAYNLMGFYENDTFSARLSYTWRDEYLSPYRASFNVIGLDNGASEFFNDYGQWDANVTWDITDRISLTAEATNLTDEKLTSYLGMKGQPMTYTTQEPRIVIGATFRM